MDVVIREYNSSHAGADKKVFVSDKDIELGQDIYIKDRLWTIYSPRVLSQIIRLDRPSFTNKDVQVAFRISAQGARNRIRGWEECGAVKLSGTISSSETGGAPSYQYAIADPRILRMVERKLYDPEALVDAALEND